MAACERSIGFSCRKPHRHDSSLEITWRPPSCSSFPYADFLTVLGTFIVAAPLYAQPPRPSPDQAVAVLQAGHSEANMTGVTLTAPDATGPQVLIFGGPPGDGPFGPFPRFLPSRRLDGSRYTDPPWGSVPYYGYGGYGDGAYGSGYHVIGRAGRSTYAGVDRANGSPRRAPDGRTSSPGGHTSRRSGNGQGQR